MAQPFATTCWAKDTSPATPVAIVKGSMVSSDSIRPVKSSDGSQEIGLVFRL